MKLKHTPGAALLVASVFTEDLRVAPGAAGSGLAADGAAACGAAPRASVTILLPVLLVTGLLKMLLDCVNKIKSAEMKNSSENTTLKKLLYLPPRCPHHRPVATHSKGVPRSSLEERFKGGLHRVGALVTNT